MSNLKILKIDDRWSVKYDPNNNDHPTELLRYDSSVGGIEHWNNPQVAMFYALLEKSQTAHAEAQPTQSAVHLKSDYSALRDKMVELISRIIDLEGEIGALLAADQGETEARPVTAARAIRDLAARPTPQAATDTRVVAQLQAISLALSKITGRDTADEVALDDLAAEVRAIRAIIGNATPAPSDKIAEAARVLLDALGDYERNRRHPAFEAAMIGQRDSNKPAPFNQIGDGLIAALRALAGQGETP